MPNCLGCESELPEGVTACPNCGAVIMSSNDPTAVSGSMAPPPPTNYGYQQTPYPYDFSSPEQSSATPQVKKRNLMSIVILTITVLTVIASLGVLFFVFRSTP